MNRKWDYEIEHAEDDKENWKIWKKEFIEDFKSSKIISYYGFIGDEIVCEATAKIDKSKVPNPEGLVDDKTAYLCAFRTIPKYIGKGCFRAVFNYMISDLKRRGYTRVTLGVEPSEVKNILIYFKYGFTNYIKSDIEKYPDGKKIIVNYYYKDI
jgi:ribosomal protein S18 acetylase RimI-like enzyme